MPVLILLVVLVSSFISEPEPEWPEITSQNRPWTRWWWMGNAVNKADLTASLAQYAEAGLGGVEITPIYGVKGFEEEFIDYLSPEWMDMLAFTLTEAKRLNLGVDMATGTGWPFGGPWITSEQACKYMAYEIYELSGGQRLAKPVTYIQKPINRTIGRKIQLSELRQPLSANDSLQQFALEQIRFEKELPLVVLMAYEEGGEIFDLTDRVDEEGMLDWIAPDGKWKLYAVFQGLHGKIVERAAPGGEGDIIDHFSKEALKHYLSKFDEAFRDHDISSLRGFFNDSYEVDDAIGEADFTPTLFTEFKKRRSYDLRDFLPALFGQDTINKRNIRILNDYRLTISELLLENFTLPWKEWAMKKEAIVRDQAHGSPANILDLYASVDIPETEGEDLLRIKFASSAGNVTGKQLISCEAATWLDEHFQSSLAEAKKNVDRFFLGGVNHIVYHGTTYSPKDAEWPGWMFYASVHFAPTNTFWNDFPALNHYVARCQSLLQSGKPDNDILLYFPFHDLISLPGRSRLQHFSGGGLHSEQTKFRLLAEELLDMGYSLDYISDKQIGELNFDGNNLLTHGGSYKVILIPPIEYVPLETFIKLTELAKSGANILFYESLPEDISGYANYDKKRRTYDELVDNIVFKIIGESGMKKAAYGKGAIVIAADIKKLLDEARVTREEMVDHGIRYLRRKNKDGGTYFIANWSGGKFNGYIPLDEPVKSVVLFNPNTDRIGLAKVRISETGIQEVYIQLEPGETSFLKTYNKKITGEHYPYFEKSGAEISLDENWELSFVSGGPTIPDTQHLNSVTFWTNLVGEDFSRFSGTARYSFKFNKPANEQSLWLLDLGSVAESATLFLNGNKLATLISPPFQTILSSDQLMDSNNTLEILVSNLMANHIIYMERNGFEYRNFYNVNFPSKMAENREANGLFTALSWEPLPSGLEGPVTLIPIRLIKF